MNQEQYFTQIDANALILTSYIDYQSNLLKAKQMLVNAGISSDEITKFMKQQLAAAKQLWIHASIVN